MSSLSPSPNSKCIKVALGSSEASWIIQPLTLVAGEQRGWSEHIPPTRQPADRCPGNPAYRPGVELQHRINVLLVLSELLKSFPQPYAPAASGQAAPAAGRNQRF